jgi:HprK-related kinase A
MRTVSSLTPQALRRQLAGPGIRLQTGPFVTHVRSPLAEVAAGIALLYGAYPLPGEERLADFHLRLTHAPGLRRWMRRQVHFDLDGIAPFKPLPVHHAFPMFEWTMNWCVSTRAHGWLIIHAAVVEKNGCAALLPAPSGSGKSTLCAALVTRGWRLLSDEMALIDLRDGLLTPVPRPVSLKNASIELIRRFAAEGGIQPVISPAVPDTSKGTVAHLQAPPDSVARAHERARPGWIIFPRYLAGAPAQLTPAPRSRAFMRLAENGFNYNLLGAAGFEALGRLVDASACCEFSYSSLDDAVAVFDALERPPAAPSA